MGASTPATTSAITGDVSAWDPGVTRRRVLAQAAALGLVGTSLAACSSTDAEQEVARALRRTGIQPVEGRSGLMRELVRCATLAPSSHNTQCWRFRLQDRSITVEPDLARRCPVVDPDDHHLFVSLGCAVENMSHAARAHGLQATPRFDAQGNGSVVVDLEPARATSSELFNAMAYRQCTRGDYDGKALSNEDLRQLEQAGTGNGVRVVLLTQRSAMETVLAHVISGNTAQIRDPAFVEELKLWIRFGADEALRTGDGLFAGVSGNPSMPRWAGSRLMELVFTAQSENDRYARQLRNSAGLALFVSDTSDKAHWVEAGRCYERFALQATALGIRNAMLNQPVEVGSIRPAFAAAVGVTRGRVDLVVRFGRGPTMPWSMRRPVDAVIV